VPSPQRLIHPRWDYPPPWRASTSVGDQSVTTLYWYAIISMEFALACVPLLYRTLADSPTPEIPTNRGIVEDLKRKDPQGAEDTLSSESDSDSYSVSARDPTPTPPNAHVGTATAQSVHSIEACYETPVGHFHVVGQEAHRKVEVQCPRYVNPRRVGKKKPLDRHQRR
jgi:hypothetical protein